MSSTDIRPFRIEVPQEEFVIEMHESFKTLR